MYVYIQSEPSLWTVGFYSPDGEWMSESDHGNKEDAANRVHWLNGGTYPLKSNHSGFLNLSDIASETKAKAAQIKTDQSTLHAVKWLREYGFSESLPQLKQYVDKL